MSVKARDFSEFADSFSPIRAHIASALKARTILTRLIHERSSDAAFAQKKAEDVMLPLQEHLVPESSLREALDHFHPCSVGYWVTTENRELKGFLGRLELYAALAGKPDTAPVSDFLRDSPRAVAAEQDLVAATLLLLRSGLDNIPVIDKQGKVIGLFDPLPLIQERRR